MKENDIAYKVIGACIEVHKSLGPGLLESAYHSCLEKELDILGLRYESEVPLTLGYKGITVDIAYRADLLIENKLLVELKAIGNINELYKA